MPSGRISRSFDTSLDAASRLEKELHGLVQHLAHIDHTMVTEQKRLEAIWRANADDEDFYIEDDEVRLPTSDLAAVEAGLARYDASLEKAFDHNFSLEDIGTAGSRPLKLYERLCEKLPSWEDLSAPDFYADRDTLMMLLIDRAKEAAG